ncbi:cell division protein FtsX [Aliikangiella marina]|uniref:Cell division protein FtsX n=1 Tax=Aliikangiella marina TaxID=1712262 RepID=A0A545T138_9GAMM|nr:permease-like cell division protein FtsX [Aliikangiella marina]TQV70928.1 cell division protein FtsX [Aliikangiella marina]
MSHEQMSGASMSQGATLSARLKMLSRLHKIEAKRGVIDIVSNPVSNFMTILVIAIALALPTGLQILLETGKTLSESWDGASRISLYLQSDVTESRLTEIAARVSETSGVDSVDTISQEQALEDFKERSGFAEAIDQLDSNPLPPVLVVQPKPTHTSPQASEELLAEFNTIREVELAQLDLDWVRKLYALIQLAEKAASALGIALALAVLLIVGNTIRLSVQNRREEIEVVKLVGATDAFIRRPFLYTGLWYGLFAGVTCWVIVTFSLYWLKDPVANLAGLYQSQFQIQGLSIGQSLKLIGISCGLGLLGSWLSVGRHIRQIEPH